MLVGLPPIYFENEPISSSRQPICAPYRSTDERPIASTDLPDLIATVGKELTGLGQAEAEPEEEKPVPAVPIKRSVTPDHIICLKDGKKLKMLKRHLKTRYDMTPDEYRRRWGLKDDYPMVAPSYAAQRSDLAKKIGLGKKPEPVAKLVKVPGKRTTKKPAAKKG